MNQEIKDYIQFGRENGFVFCCKVLDAKYGPEYNINIEYNEVVLTKDGEGYNGFNIIETITSKPFIEAIARGIMKNSNNGLIFLKDRNGIEYEITLGEFEEIIEFVIEQQAHAIAEDKLQEFINTIL